MTLSNKHGEDGMDYAVTPVTKTKKKDIKVITEMSTSAIFKHLVVKHKYALVSLYAFALTAYLVYDKVLTIFINGVQPRMGAYYDGIYSACNSKLYGDGTS